MGRVLVVVPLREGAQQEAVDLLRMGPPLELQARGVERYGAFVTNREAILVVEGARIGSSDAQSWEDLSAWKNAGRWDRCVESPPRLAESIHTWERPPDLEGLFFGPLPGPGDSEGGDVL